MKGFAYTARDAAGKTKSGVISADDRTAAIREIRALNLVPITLEERAGPILGPANRKPLPMRTLVLAVGVLVVAAIALLMFLKRPATARPPTAPSAAPAAPVAPSALVAPSTPAVPVAPVVTAPPKRPHHPGYTTVTPVVQKDEPLPLSSLPPSSVQTNQRAQRPRQDPPSNVLIVNPPPTETNTPPAKPLLQRTTEQRLALYAMPGIDMPPPPPDMGETDDLVQDALTNKIVITEADDEATQRLKETVAQMKEDLREYLAAGGTTKDFFAALTKRQVEEAEMVNVARRFVIEKIEAGEMREAQDAFSEVNAYLAEQGIPPISLPSKYRKHLKAAQ